MAVVYSRYNHTVAKFLAQLVDLDNIKIMLLNGDGTFDATDTDIDDVAGAASPHRANEVYGNGWTEGGEVMDSMTVTTINTNGAKLDADDESHDATGGAIGPADNAVAYDATNNWPLWHVAFGESRQADEGVAFKVRLSANGLVTIG